MLAYCLLHCGGKDMQCGTPSSMHGVPEHHRKQKQKQHTNMHVDIFFNAITHKTAAALISEHTGSGCASTYRLTGKASNSDPSLDTLRGEQRWILDDSQTDCLARG